MQMKTAIIGILKLKQPGNPKRFPVALFYCFVKITFSSFDS